MHSLNGVLISHFRKIRITHSYLCAVASYWPAAPLWRNSPPRCSHARTRLRPGARAPSAVPSCCCKVTSPPPVPTVSCWLRDPVDSGCVACSESARAPPRSFWICGRPSCRTGTWRILPQTRTVWERAKLDWWTTWLIDRWEGRKRSSNARSSGCPRGARALSASLAMGQTQSA